MQENVGALEIPMKYFNLVESLEPPHNLNEYFPDIVFADVLLLLLMLGDLLEQVSIVRVLHYDAKRHT